MRQVRKPLLILLSCLIFAIGGCSGDDPINPGSGGGHTILLLSDGGSEDHVKEILKASGITVWDGGLFHEFTGAGLNDQVDGVILLSGPAYNNDMHDAGEAALVAFVTQGGGLFVNEWFTYAAETQGYHQILKSILPVSYAGTYGKGTDRFTVLEDHPITSGVASPYDSPTATDYSVVAPKSGATQLVRGSRTGASITTWDVPGRVVHWNSAGAYSSDEVWNAPIDKLITNAAHYICNGNRDAEPITSTTLKLTGIELDITNDGDAGSVGDFYITMRISTLVNGESNDVATLSKALVQGSDGDRVSLSHLSVEAEIPEIDGYKIITRMSFYENDPDGPHASAGMSNTYVYNAAEDCWDRESDEVCVRSGSAKNGSLNLQNFQGAPLDADLYWRFSVD